MSDMKKAVVVGGSNGIGLAIAENLIRRGWRVIVLDRCEGDCAILPEGGWSYENGKISVMDPVPFHRYTASFLCCRVWEEINMYNQTTNHWTSEHLMQLDPRQSEALYSSMPAFVVSNFAKISSSLIFTSSSLSFLPHPGRNSSVTSLTAAARSSSPRLAHTPFIA